MVDPFVLVYARENGLPLVHSESGDPLVLDPKKDSEKAADLAGFLVAIEGFSPEMRFTSARFREGKKPHNIIVGTTDDPVPLAVFNLDSRELQGDPFKIGRLITFHVLSFFEWHDFGPHVLGSYSTSAPKKAIKEVCQSLSRAYDKPIGADRSFHETVLSVAQLNDIHELGQSQGFFCPLEAPIIPMKSEIPSGQYKLLRKILAHEKPQAVGLNLLNALQDVFFRESKVKPECIELRNARSEDIRYRIHFFYPKKKFKNATPAWMVLTVENPGVETVVRLLGEINPEYAKMRLSLEELRKRFLKLEFQPELTGFQFVVQRLFGPLAYSGVRGVIRLYDLLKIGTPEGAFETEIDAGLRRIKTDSKLQERLLASLERRSGA
jgi:hypothetical protein